MDNPAVHDLDDVRLRAENGQLVLEVNGQTTPVNVDVDGNLSLDELEGFTDDEISLLQSKLVDAGHDEVDVPQVRNLTVEDWESGTLDTDLWVRDTSYASVQSTVVADGSYALELSRGIADSIQIHNQYGYDVYPQIGDTFSYKTYVTGTEDISRFDFGNQFTSTTGTGYAVLIQSGSFEIKKENVTESSQSITDTLDEWLKISVEWGIDGEIVAKLFDSNSNKLAQLSYTDTEYTSGGIGFEGANFSSPPEVYFDSLELERRSPEYFSDTQKGITELGNEVTPSGAIHTGPLESSTNALRQEYATAPVNSDATQGDTSLLTLLKSGVNPAMYMERTMDGQGGAYGHQLQAPLGRFSRINVNLSWEYNSLSDVANWTSDGGGDSVWTFNVNGRPRRIHVEHDGSGTENDYGGVGAEVLTTFESIGAFRVTFHDVSFSRNANTYQGIHLGLTDAAPSTDIRNTGNGIVLSTQGDGALQTVTGGTRTEFSNLGAVDWSVNHDVAIEYDGSNVRFFLDGVQRNGEGSYSTNADFRPVIQLEDDEGGPTSGDTAEVDRVTVEPLPEVLQ